MGTIEGKENNVFELFSWHTVPVKIDSIGRRIGVLNALKLNEWPAAAQEKGRSSYNRSLKEYRSMRLFIFNEN